MRGLFAILLLLFLIQCKNQETTETQVDRNISVSQAASLHSQGYIYVDLRTEREINETSLINNAKTIDFKGSGFEQAVSQLPKNEKYILYCRSGGRSSNALKTFESNGLDAYNMLGGYIEWNNSQ